MGPEMKGGSLVGATLVAVLLSPPQFADYSVAARYVSSRQGLV